jgi:hypothetical protein
MGLIGDVANVGIAGDLGNNVPNLDTFLSASGVPLSGRLPAC